MLDLVRRWRLSFPRMAGLARALGGQCPLCRQWCGDLLCESCARLCADDLRARCGLCALALPPGAEALRCGRCATHPPPLSRCIVALDYLFPWDRLLQAFKFNERLDLAALLADRLDAAIRRSGTEPPDLIVPVPLSDARMRERGYNQSLEIARRLRCAAQRQSRLCARTLLRVRHTGPQSRLPLDERRKNLRAAFAVVKPVYGLRVVLVDDVMTSGATLFEAADALRRAGAAEVQAWAVARTP